MGLHQCEDCLLVVFLFALVVLLLFGLFRRGEFFFETGEEGVGTRREPGEGTDGVSATVVGGLGELAAGVGGEGVELVDAGGAVRVRRIPGSGRGSNAGWSCGLLVGGCGGRGTGAGGECWQDRSWLRLRFVGQGGIFEGRRRGRRGGSRFRLGDGLGWFRGGYGLGRRLAMLLGFRGVAEATSEPVTAMA